MSDFDIGITIETLRKWADDYEKALLDLYRATRPDAAPGSPAPDQDPTWVPISPVDQLGRIERGLAAEVLAMSRDGRLPVPEPEEPDEEPEP